MMMMKTEFYKQIYFDHVKNKGVYCFVFECVIKIIMKIFCLVYFCVKSNIEDFDLFLE